MCAQSDQSDFYDWLFGNKNMILKKTIFFITNNFSILRKDEELINIKKNSFNIVVFAPQLS